MTEPAAGTTSGTSGTSGTPVRIGHRTYYVRIVSESVRRTVYWVSCPDGGGRRWKPAEVRVGRESRFVCLGCRNHPGADCVHVTAAMRAAALEPMPATPETTRDAMLRELGAPAGDAHDSTDTTNAPPPAHGAED